LTRRRLVLYAACGVLVFAVTLVATAPAAWVAYAVERASEERLELRAPAGTLWSGSGHLYGRGAAGLLDLGALQWRTLWSDLPRARLSVALNLGKARKPALVQASPAGIAVRDLDVAVPAPVLTGFVPALASLGPQGTLGLRSDDLRFESGSILGLADVEWRDVRLARMPTIALGSHRARLRGGGRQVNIELETIEGPLRLSGSGTWTRESGLALAGTAEHDPREGGVLAEVLKGACTSYRDNRCSFRFRR